jgi:multimeric flavodoxin WrbA
VGSAYDLRATAMKVLAFNGSPNMDKGNTALILSPFLDGMREAGAAAELFYTSRLKIRPCAGDFNCWFKTPGKCHQQDDMQMLHPKLRESDVWVFATPVYWWGVSGPLKNLMDRMLPLIEPFIDMRDGHCSHPVRPDTGKTKLVLVASCGFWEMDNFDPLLAQMRFLCKTLGFEFAGALLRPHGPALAAMMDMGPLVQDVFAAAREAGRQLVTTGAIPAELQQTVSRTLMPRLLYRTMANRQSRQALKHLSTAS